MPKVIFMDKVEKMKELIRDWEAIKVRSAADMCCATEESEKIFAEMWDFARENGFVDENGTISVD